AEFAHAGAGAGAGQVRFRPPGQDRGTPGALPRPPSPEPRALSPDTRHATRRARELPLPRPLPLPSGLTPSRAQELPYPLLRREPDAHVEAAELAEAGTRLVEAHVGDDALDVEEVVGEERDAPLPVVESDGAGDDLVDLLREATAREPVL